MPTLNDAAAVLLGSTPAQAVYLGAAKVWPQSGNLWTPPASCVLWLDATDLATITASGGAVSAWGDKSGHNHSFVQSTESYQPATGTRTYRGNNVLDFDGSAGLGCTPFAYNVATWAILAVCESDRDAPNSYDAVFSMSNSGPDWNKPDGLVMHQGSGVEHNCLMAALRANSSGVPSKFGGAGITPAAVWATRYIDQSTNSCQTYRDGLKGTRSGTSTGLNVFAPSSGAAVGCRTNQGNVDIAQGSAWDGWIGEIICLNTGTSDNDFNSCGRYLADKWGFTWTNVTGL